MALRPRFRLLPRRRPRLQLESLEDRTTPAGTDISASGKNFTVTNAATESIALTVGLTGGNYVLEIIGSTFTTSESKVTLSNGDHQATIPADKVNSWDFLLGDLNDSLVVGTGSLDSFVPVTVLGDNIDSLTLNDSTDSTNNTYSISATGVTRTGSVTADFSGINQLSLTGGTGDDTINVTATAAGTPVTVSGGDGHDTITVGSTGNSLDDIKGAVTVNGDSESGGGDRLNIDDQDDTDNNTYKFTATTIDRTGAGLITYATVEEVVLNATDKTDSISVESTASASEVTVNAGDGDDTVTVKSSPSDSPVTVNGGVGNDTVSVGNGSLDGVLGTVSVSGGLGSDVLKIDDSTDGDGNTYSVGVLQITRAGAGDISYSSVGTVNLTAGSGADHITVKATTALTVKVDAGIGSDSVTVGNGSLDNLTGTLTLIAGAGVGDTDTLTMDDSADTTDNTYTITAAAAIRTTGTDVSFDYASSGFEQLVLLAGKGDDTVTAPTLDGLVAGVSINGGIGSDQLVVNDSAQTNGHTYSVSASSIQRTDGTLVGLGYSSFDDVTLSAGSGDDTISVTSTAGGSTLTVNAGAGGDTISLAASAAGSTVTLNAGLGSDGISVGGGSLDNLKGSLALSAGVSAGDTDTLTIDDSADTTDNTYTVSATKAVRTTGTDVTFNYASSDFEELVLMAGTGTDTIGISATASGIPVTVSGGGGNDAISLGPLDGIAGPVTVNGNDGTTDALTVDDSGDSGSDIYGVTATQITRSDNSVTIDYGTVENLTLKTGGGADKANVTATLAGTTLTLEMGNGNDTVAAGSGTLLDAVAGTVSVIAGSGNDQLNLFDQGFGTATTYKVDSGQVTRIDGSVTVAYTGQTEQVSLKTGSEANTINILGTPNGSNLTITGGLGNDTVTAGSGTLDDLLGDVTVHAGDGTNKLNVDDSTDASDNDYTITSTEVTRTDAATLTYSEFSKFTLAAGTGKNTITVTSTSTAETTVAGGTGADTFDITGAGLAKDSTNIFEGGDESTPEGDTFTVTPVPDVGGAKTTILIDGGKGAGSDTLFVKLDKSQSTPPTFTLTQVKFATGFLPIDYSEIEDNGLDTPTVTLTSVDTDDVLTITATQVDEGTYKLGTVTNKFRNVESFEWDAGDGNDTLVINNPANGLFAPVSGITFNSGGQAGDALQILGGKATSGAFEVGANPGDVRITHTGAADTMTINATGLSTKAGATAVQDSVTEDLFTTFARDAADTITVTDDGLLTRVELSEGDGVAVEVLNKTRLEVHGGDAVAGGDAADIIDVKLSALLGGAKFVDVKGDDGADTIAIQSVPTDRFYTVDGGIGDDTVNIGQAGSLATVLGAGTVAGGTGADVLNIDDKADVGPIAYTITATSVDRAGVGIITYGAVESLVVDATQGADTILVNSTPAATAVRVNAGAGNDAVTVADTSGSFFLDAGAGDDVVTVVGTSGSFFLDGADGNDSITVGTGSLDTLLGAVSVLGGLGTDTLSVDDSKDSSDNTYLVDATQVVRTTDGSAAVDFDTLEQLALTAGAGDNAIEITATSATVAVSVTAGTGDDVVTVGVGTLDNLLGTLNLDAGGGSDKLVVDDSADSDDNTYSITNADVSRTNGTVVSFAYPAQGFEELVLTAGTGNDTVFVSGTATDIPVTVLGGGGNETVTVGDGSLDSLLADVSVDGGTGADRLAVDDAKDTNDNVYTLDSNDMSRTDGAVAVDYSTFEQVALAAGAGNDTISVPSLEAGVVAAVDAGTGDDVVTAGDGSLDNLLGTLMPDGGAGSANRLIVDDSTDSTDNNYDISTTSVTRSGTPVVIPYTSNFQSVLLQAGTGDDAIALASSAAILVSVDGGDGNDSFSLLGLLSGSVAGGDGNDTIAGDNVGRTYTLTGGDAGSVSGILAAGFTAVENLTAGSGDDIFTFNNGGSLSGTVTGGNGKDTLNGDDAGREFHLTEANFGFVKDLVKGFNTLENLNGGAGNDTLMVADDVPVNGLNQFNGGIGFDTADLKERSGPQQIAIFARGPLDGFNATGGSAGVAGSSIVTQGFVNIDRVYGSDTSKADILAGFGAANATWHVNPHDGAEDSYTATGRSLAFDQFEQLVGQGGDDEFRIDFPVDDAATSRLLLRGGGGTDVVRMIGGANDDTLTVLPKDRNWPSGSSTSPLFAGLQFNSVQPVLYDDTVETLDLQGGAGDDTFRVDPGAKPPKGTPATPLYGNAVRTLWLQGQLGEDTFVVVPDTFNAISPNRNPKVTIHVFGGFGNQALDGTVFGTVAAVDEPDRMTLYRLPLKLKANFPVEGKGGKRTNVFDLRWLHFAPVHFYNMWTVKADIKAPPAA